MVEQRGERRAHLLGHRVDGRALGLQQRPE
jgi:hypothetical protein